MITVAGLLAGSTKAERLASLWEKLQEYYARVKPPCVLDNLTETMIKKDKSKPKLNAKGAECRYIIPFCAQLAQQFADKHVHYSTRAELFQHLVSLAHCISADAYAKDEAVAHCRKFCILYASLGEEAKAKGKDLWQPKPKMHLLQELVEYQSPQWGSPRLFWCYRDESWCGFWARASTRRGGPDSAAATAARMLDRYRAFEDDAFD